MIELIISAKGVPEEKAFTFEQNIIKIGRVKENDISLPGANISRLHCLITFENGEYYVSDQSANVTQLNGEAIGKGRKMPLRHGDKIQAGEFFLQFKVKTPEDIVGNDNFRLMMTLKQGPVRVCKAVPIFHDWSFSCGLDFDDKEIDPDSLEHTLQHAAKYGGFGDFRPTFGRAIASISHE